MKFRRRLLVSLPAMSLTACAALPGGPAVSDRVDAAQRRARATADALDAWVERIAMLPLGASMRQQVQGVEPDGRLIEYLAAILNEIPPRDVYGVYIAFEDKKWTDPLSMPWVDRKSWPKGTVVTYDYHDPKQDWYSGPKRTGALYITEPYFDEGGSDITMVSITRPVRDRTGRFIGVAGADISLQDIDTRLQSSDGDMFLVSKAGTVIGHPEARLMPRKGYAGERLRNLPAGPVIAAQASGSTRAVVNGSPRTFVWQTAPLTGWRVVISLP
jgi:C4-dicarboxylate-specific signal transduction histidine kinase